MKTNEVMSLKVSSKGEAPKLAGAITNYIQESGEVKLECIGAGALNVAIKGVTIAMTHVISSGKELYIQPFFRNIEIDGEEKTGIVLKVTSHDK